jgi:hypothetical protein
MPAKAAVSPDIESASWALYTDDSKLHSCGENNPEGLSQKVGRLRGNSDAIFGKPVVQTSHRASVFNSFCELSELVHETLYLLLTPSHPPQSRELLALYTKYLSWYDLLPDFFRLGHNSTPAVLFAQYVSRSQKPFAY